MRPVLAPGIERPERPPFVLRWVWRVGPLLVLAAMAGMFVAARSAPAPERAAAQSVALEAYSERGGLDYRVQPGARLHPGEAVRFVVAPAKIPYVTVGLQDGTVIAELGPLDPAQARVELGAPMPLGSAGPQRVTALFSTRPLAHATVQIALARRGLADTPLPLPATEVSIRLDVAP
jgi:hypothetical protein